ncbi:MAG: pirin family protein [Burkholderiaceae bacterium]
MSVLPANQPEDGAPAGPAALRIESKPKDLGSFTVRRVLPAPDRRMVGPFIFFDHMGPAEFPPGEGIVVRPHPHIGLATITYLFEGEIMHRDSLGVVQPIRAGAVNFMKAGRGIVHSERAGDDLDTHSKLHGIQSWMALPDARQEDEPSFDHYPADALPQFAQGDVTVRVIIGEAWGKRSPVRADGRMLYLECQMPAGSSIEVPSTYPELAAYVVSGNARIDAEDCTEGTMLVAQDGQPLRIKATEPSRVMVIGGEPVGERHIWWNFVSSSKARIEQAQADWKANRFPHVPGETEFIPLPD